MWARHRVTVRATPKGVPGRGANGLPCRPANIERKSVPRKPAIREIICCNATQSRPTVCDTTVSSEEYQVQLTASMRGDYAVWLMPPRRAVAGCATQERTTKYELRTTSFYA